jgi:hypothetical protein
MRRLRLPVSVTVPRWVASTETGRHFEEVIESFQAIQSQKFERASTDQVLGCCMNNVDILDCILNKTRGGLCRKADYNATVGTCAEPRCSAFTQVSRKNVR